MPLQEVCNQIEQGKEVSNAEDQLKAVLAWSFEALSLAAKNMFLDTVR